MKSTPSFWKVWLVFLFVVGSGFVQANADPNEDYSNGVIPSPPCPFPEQFKNYQILPSSISPDKQYALLYPKRLEIYQLKEYSLYLISLKPFKILTIVPIYDTNLVENVHGWYEVKWSADSSAVMVIEGSKWGPAKLFLITIRNGYAGSITDLTDEVMKRGLADFWESKCEPFNDWFDILFSGTHEQSFLNKNQIKINYKCTNDPKNLKKDTWNVRFEGVWDISKGEFTSKKITPLPKAP